MTYLFENDSQEELSSAKKGDKFVVLTTKGQLDYSTVKDTRNYELTIINNNSEYTLFANSSIEGNKLSFKDTSGKWLNIKFARIYIKHADTGKVTVIEPQGMEPDENAQDIDPEFKNSLAKDFLHFKEEISELKDNSKLHLTYGTHEFNGEGEYIGTATKTTDLSFIVSKIDGKVVTLKLLNVSGHDDSLSKFIHKSFYLEIDRDLFTLDKGGIKMKLRHDKGRVILNYMIGMDSEDIKMSEELLAKEAEASRKKFAQVIYDCERGDTFTLTFGKKVDNFDGKYEMDGNTKTIASFIKMGDLKNMIYTRMVKLDGPLSDDYLDYQGEYIYFNMDENLFTFDDTGVIINAKHGNDVLNFKYVFMVKSDNMSKDNQDDLKDIDDEKESKTDRVAKNKDLLRLLHHKTWRDRLLGRDGVGIMPTDDTEKKLGLNKGSKGHVEFKLLSKDIVIGGGRNIHIKKDVPITGKMFSSGRIIHKSRNSKESIHFFLNNTKKRDIYDVKIIHVDSSGQKNNLGTGRIEILS